MLFSRYAKISSIAAGAVGAYNTNVDTGHTPLTGLTVNATIQGPVLLQVGCFDGTTFTPYYTRGLSGAAYPLTFEDAFPNYTNDGSQQVAIRVTNLDTVTRDAYLDISGTET